MITPEAQARQHRLTRRANRVEAAEDYVELIADLIDTKGEARAIELAQRFGVAPATVTKIVARLQREGLVATEPYRAIFLTEAGRSMAEASRRRHAILLRFLRAIGVSEDTAFADAEGMEHHLSDETARKLDELTDRLISAGD
jgi:DtxR family manganese transport transcriptional regulator